MRHEEERLLAAVEELKTCSATTTDHATLADLAIIVDGFKTMLPYVSVGLKVCPSEETLEAINRLDENGERAQGLRNTLMNAMELAQKRNVPLTAQHTARKPCRRVASRSLKRSPALQANRMNWQA